MGSLLSDVPHVSIRECSQTFGSEDLAVVDASRHTLFRVPSPKREFVGSPEHQISFLMSTVKRHSLLVRT